MRDDAQRTVTLARPAERIVSLAPHLTEILFAIGAGSRVVGASAFSDYPPAARAIPRVGGHAGIDVERVLALTPELVVGWGSGNPPGDLEHVRTLGLPLFISEPRSVEDIADTAERLGRLTGRVTEADALGREVRRRAASLTRRYGGGRRVTVFYQIWGDPVITLNGGHLVGRLIERCGGDNVFGALAAVAPQVSAEAVLARDPEVIIASGADAHAPTWLDAWRRWPSLRAVRRGRLHHIPPDMLLRPTPRILDGMEAMCRLLDAARRDPAR